MDHKDLDIEGARDQIVFALETLISEASSPTAKAYGKGAIKRINSLCDSIWSEHGETMKIKAERDAFLRIVEAYK